MLLGEFIPYLANSYRNLKQALGSSDPLVIASAKFLEVVLDHAGTPTALSKEIH